MARFRFAKLTANRGNKKGFTVLGTKDNFNSAGGGNGGARLERLYARLSAVPEGAEVVEMLKRLGTTIEFDPAREIGAYTNITFGHDNGRNITYSKFEIIACDKSGDDWLIQAIAHESQHIRHHSEKLGNPEFERTTEQECLLRRAQEADAQVKATGICWELKQAGDAGPWEAASKSIYAPMCRAYEAEMAGSNDKVAARRAAFDAWFDDDRLYFYDYNTLINNYFYQDNILVKNNGAVARLLNDGMGAEEIAAAKSRLAEVLHKLGGLGPAAQNYLDLPGSAPVDGPPYTRNLAENLEDGRDVLFVTTAKPAGNGNKRHTPLAPLRMTV
jgi:hypothetical protein